MDFLVQVEDDEDFILVASFDEPHGPSVVPPEYWENFQMDDIPRRPNFGVSSEDVPHLQQVHRDERPVNPEDWESYRSGLQRHYACNAYVDREIGRVIDATERLHFGDSDRISHPFVYFPPAEPVKGTESTHLHGSHKNPGIGRQL